MGLMVYQVFLVLAELQEQVVNRELMVHQVNLEQVVNRELMVHQVNREQVVQTVSTVLVV